MSIYKTWLNSNRHHLKNHLNFTSENPDNYIQLTGKKDGLIVKQLWDKKEIMLQAKSPTYFYNNEQGYPLQIIKNSNGEVIQLVILGLDVFDKVK